MTEQTTPDLRNAQPETTYCLDEAPPPPRACYYYEPFQLHRGGEAQGAYHYCRMAYPGERIEPVGYCAVGCSGHASPSGAREHYRQFLLDNRLTFRTREDCRACAVCGEETCVEALLMDDTVSMFWAFNLCGAHQTRANVERLFVLLDFATVQACSIPEPDFND